MQLSLLPLSLRSPPPALACEPMQASAIAALSAAAHLSAPRGRGRIDEATAIRRAVRRKRAAMDGSNAGTAICNVATSFSSSFSSSSGPATASASVVSADSGETALQTQPHSAVPEAMLRESAARAIQCAWRAWKGRKGEDAANSSQPRKRRRMEDRGDARAVAAAATQATATATAAAPASAAATEPSGPASALSVVGRFDCASLSPSVRAAAMFEVLVRQREAEGDRMSAAVDAWGRAELDKERRLLKALLTKESALRRAQRQATHSKERENDPALRALFAPLYAHYRHLQSLLLTATATARPGLGTGTWAMRPQVPLFHAQQSAFTRVSAPQSPTASASLPSMSALVAEKRSLQARLAHFSSAFVAERGRVIRSAEDVGAVKAEWARYKYLKYALLHRLHERRVGGGGASTDGFLTAAASSASTPPQSPSSPPSLSPASSAPSTPLSSPSTAPSSPASPPSAASWSAIRAQFALAALHSSPASIAPRALSASALPFYGLGLGAVSTCSGARHRETALYQAARGLHPGLLQPLAPTLTNDTTWC